MSVAAKVFVDQDMGEAVLTAFAGGEVAILSRRCPGKESANEDGAVILSVNDRSGLLAVTDGMGGGPAGEEASRIALRALVAAARAGEGKGLREVVLSALETANRQVLDLGLGAATTLALAEIDQGVLRSYHVGDAHLLLVGQRGKIKRLTVAHAPVSYAVEAGVLDESEALQHEDRHLVSNVVGQEDMRIEMGAPIRLRPRDTLVLATDGIFDNLKVDEIVQLVRVGPLLGCMRAMLEACQRRMRGEDDDQPSKPDDFTLIVFRPTATGCPPVRAMPAPAPEPEDAGRAPQ